MRSSASVDYHSFTQSIPSNRQLLPSKALSSGSRFHPLSPSDHQRTYHTTDGHIPSNSFPTHQRSLGTLPPLGPNNGTPSSALRHSSIKFDRRNIDIRRLADSAVTSPANSDDEGDIPTEAMVRPIHVLDSTCLDYSAICVFSHIIY
jgi:hypothetical protein